MIQSESYLKVADNTGAKRDHSASVCWVAPSASIGEHRRCHRRFRP